MAVQGNRQKLCIMNQMQQGKGCMTTTLNIVKKIVICSYTKVLMCRGQKFLRMAQNRHIEVWRSAGYRHL